MFLCKIFGHKWLPIIQMFDDAKYCMRCRKYIEKGNTFIPLKLKASPCEDGRADCLNCTERKTCTTWTAGWGYYPWEYECSNVKCPSYNKLNYFCCELAYFKNKGAGYQKRYVINCPIYKNKAIQGVNNARR